MKVAELTVDEFRVLIKQAVHEELQEIIADPDKGLDLNGEIQIRLQSSLNSVVRIPFEEVKSRLNLS